MCTHAQVHVKLVLCMYQFTCAYKINCFSVHFQSKISVTLNACNFYFPIQPLELTCIVFNISQRKTVSRSMHKFYFEQFKKETWIYKRKLFLNDLFGSRQPKLPSIACWLFLLFKIFQAVISLICARPGRRSWLQLAAS